MTDPGLQPHRTALAWHRTALSLFLVSVSTALAAARHESLWVCAAALASCAAAAAFGWRRFPRGRDRDHTSPSIWPILVVAVCVALSVAAIGIGTAVWALVH